MGCTSSDNRAIRSQSRDLRRLGKETDSVLYSPLPEATSNDPFCSPKTLQVGNSRSSTGAGLDVVQFTTPIYYVEEEEGFIQIDIMRLGSMRGRVKVNYHTEDASAKAGTKYIAASGQVVFQSGESRKSIQIGIVSSSTWAATLEFQVVLDHAEEEGAESCSLGRYLRRSRVKIIDGTQFPSSKYANLNSKDAIESISGWGLFAEYIKLMLAVEGNLWRTILTLIMDQLKNLYLFYTIYASVYLVNVVLNTHDDGTVEQLYGYSRDAVAMSISVLYVAPMMILHLWDIVKIRLNLHGRIRVFIQANLFRKYLNFSENSREIVVPSDVQTAVMQKAEDLAGGGTAMLEVIQIFGKVAVLMYFTLMENPNAIIFLLALPVVICIWGFIRSAACEPDDSNVGKLKRELKELVSETCEKYRLIANYFQRPQMNDLFASKLTALRRSELPVERYELNNKYFQRWLAPAFIGAYIMLGTPKVVEKELSLGTFLATLSIFKEVCGDFLEAHGAILRVMEEFGTLRDLTLFFNRELDVLQWKTVNRKRRQTTKQKQAQMEQLERHSRQAGDTNDMMTIDFQALGFAYENGSQLFKDLNVSVQQGRLVALMGQSGTGKTTLLRLLGHELFPTEGSLFVPTHLRILHVSQEIYIMNLSTMDNLTFGCSRADLEDPDLDNRITTILANLSMDHTSRLVKQMRGGGTRRTSVFSTKSARFNEDKSGVQSCCSCGDVEFDDEEETVHTCDARTWQAEIHYTEMYKIHLARALIMNPEVMALQRPLHHFNADEGQHVLKVIKTHIQHRGIGLDENGRHLRRPRTVFFTAESLSQAQEADDVWTLGFDRDDPDLRILEARPLRHDKAHLLSGRYADIENGYDDEISARREQGGRLSPRSPRSPRQHFATHGF